VGKKEQGRRKGKHNEKKRKGALLFPIVKIWEVRSGRKRRYRAPKGKKIAPLEAPGKGIPMLRGRRT